MESNSSSRSNKRKRTGEEVEAKEKAKVLKFGINSGNNNNNDNGGIPTILSDPALLDCNGEVTGMESNSGSSNKRKRTGEEVEAKAKVLKVGVSSGNNNDNGNGGIPVLLSDPSLLDCNICLKPLSPPVFQCKFVGSSEQLSQHFKDNHSSERTEFSFGKPFSVRVKLYEPFVALQSSDGPVFLLNNFNIITSNSFTIVSLGNNNPEVKNLYRLTLKNGDDILTFSSRAKVTDRKNETSTLNCCSLTLFFFGFTHSVLGQFELEITIYPE
ncbi:hypothetical protein Sjap_018070 [Stephania japonica]|uniref:Uncharacterized protein n=1 Tax=Stephania japonica TaxID=461633 RepID=A0AAP0I7F4_9MAGN